MRKGKGGNPNLTPEELKALAKQRNARPEWFPANTEKDLQERAKDIIEQRNKEWAAKPLAKDTTKRDENGFESLETSSVKSVKEALSAGAKELADAASACARNLGEFAGQLMTEITDATEQAIGQLTTALNTALQGQPASAAPGNSRRRRQRSRIVSST